MMEHPTKMIMLLKRPGMSMVSRVAFVRRTEKSIIIEAKMIWSCFLRWRRCVVVKSERMRRR